MTVRMIVGDVFDRLAEIPDGSIDLVCTSPPFLGVRSYLPAGHPDKGREIGHEATPGDYLQTLLELTAEFGRVLAPHGSIFVELGDSYAGAYSAHHQGTAPDVPISRHSGKAIREGRNRQRDRQFGGSGTTGIVASGHGRDCTLIDLDDRNVDLARERLGMLLEVAG